MITTYKKEGNNYYLPGWDRLEVASLSWETWTSLFGQMKSVLAVSVNSYSQKEARMQHSTYIFPNNWKRSRQRKKKLSNINKKKIMQHSFIAFQFSLLWFFHSRVCVSGKFCPWPFLWVMETWSLCPGANGECLSRTWVSLEDFPTALPGSSSQGLPGTKFVLWRIERVNLCSGWWCYI